MFGLYQTKVIIGIAGGQYQIKVIKI